MSHHTFTRRALLAGAGATVSSAALAAVVSPAVFADDLGVETASDRVERLAIELSAALTETYGGQFKAVIGPDGEVSYTWAHPTAEQRVEAALVEFKAAFEAAHSVEEWHIVRDDDGALRMAIPLLAEPVVQFSGTGVYEVRRASAGRHQTWGVLLEEAPSRGGYFSRSYFVAGDRLDVSNNRRRFIPASDLVITRKIKSITA